jgi:hypothetical protein
MEYNLKLKKQKKIKTNWKLSYTELNSYGCALNGNYIV